MAEAWAIAAARFYDDLADKLIDGARRVFEEAGGTVDVYEVPGAYELPLLAKYCAESGRYAGVACVGAVIRGETDHYDYVCGEAARGLQQVQLATGIPIGFGILTVDSMEQALARVQGGGKRDSGAHAAEAVLAALAVKAAIRERRAPTGFSPS